MISVPTFRVLLFDVGLLDKELRHTLHDSSIQVLETADVDAGVQILRDSSEPMAALFGVSLAAQTLTGLDQITLLGSLLSDEELARRHSFILATRTPEEVRQVLGRVLDRTHVQLLTAPVDRERLLATLWLAGRHIAAQEAAALTVDVP